MADKPIEARLTVIENALTKSLGIDLANFDPEEARTARAAALEQAKAAALATLETTVNEAVTELSIDERFARLERALTQSTGAKL